MFITRKIFQNLLSAKVYAREKNSRMASCFCFRIFIKIVKREGC